MESTEVKRHNRMVRGDPIQDSPATQEARRKKLAEEMARKKFRIEYETWERTQSGEVSRLAPKS